MTCTSNASVFLKVVEYLRNTTGPRTSNLTITCDTEVYHDLHVYGHDLVELANWLNREFGVEMNLKFSDYVPPEVGPLGLALRQILRRMAGRPQYKSLKVGDIVAAIEAKRWPDEAQA